MTPTYNHVWYIVEFQNRPNQWNEYFIDENDDNIFDTYDQANAGRARKMLHYSQNETLDNWRILKVTSSQTTEVIR